jgi:hypothetical protein
MKRIILAGLALATTIGVAAPAAASASNHYIGCDDNYRIAPRQCMFVPYENASHAESTPIKSMHWHSWGGARAYGRGTYVYNSGYRAPVHFRAYRRTLDDEGDFIYTRLRGVIGRGCWDDTERGGRRCDPPGTKHRFATRVW